MRAYIDVVSAPIGGVPGAAFRDIFVELIPFFPHLRVGLFQWLDVWVYAQNLNRLLRQVRDKQLWSIIHGYC